MTSVYQSAAGSFFVHLSLKIFQPLKRLKHIPFLCQLRVLSHPLFLPETLSSHARLRSHPLWKRAAKMAWNTFEFSNRSVTKSTIMEIIRPFEPNRHTHAHLNENDWKARECELISKQEPVGSLNSSQKLLIKLSGWCPAPFTNPTEDRFD